MRRSSRPPPTRRGRTGPGGVESRRAGRPELEVPAAGLPGSQPCAGHVRDELDLEDARQVAVPAAVATLVRRTAASVAAPVTAAPSSRHCCLAGDQLPPPVRLGFPSQT
jgi:hypothetical protein